MEKTREYWNLPCRENSLTVLGIIGKFFSILCWIVFIAGILSAFYGLSLTGDAIHASNWGGAIYFIGTEISIKGAFWVGGISFFAGGMISFLFGKLAETLWYAAD